MSNDQLIGPELVVSRRPRTGAGPSHSSGILSPASGYLVCDSQPEPTPTGRMCLQAQCCLRGPHPPADWVLKIIFLSWGRGVGNTVDFNPLSGTND